MNNEIQKYCLYGSFFAQQVRSFKKIFTPFLLEHEFTHIIEIGTAGAGFTAFLRDASPDSKILSFDIEEKPEYSHLRQFGVDIQIKNIFSEEFFVFSNPVNNDAILNQTPKIIDEKTLDFLSEKGKKLILCDGGNKIAEFNCLSNHMNVGDFIMAHDYSPSYEYFEKNVKGVSWDWCEIEEKYISYASIRNNLFHYQQKRFQSIVWVCKQKEF